MLYFKGNTRKHVASTVNNSEKQAMKALRQVNSKRAQRGRFNPYKGQELASNPLPTLCEWDAVEEGGVLIILENNLTQLKSHIGRLFLSFFPFLF